MKLWSSSLILCHVIFAKLVCLFNAHETPVRLALRHEMKCYTMVTDRSILLYFSFHPMHPWAPLCNIPTLFPIFGLRHGNLFDNFPSLANSYDYESVVWTSTPPLSCFDALAPWLNVFEVCIAPPLGIYRGALMVQRWAGTRVFKRWQARRWSLYCNSEYLCVHAK